MLSPEVLSCQDTPSSSNSAEESASDAGGTDIEVKFVLSKTITMFPHKKIAKHRKVVLGEICSGIESLIRPCVVKFDPHQVTREVKALRKLTGYSNIANLIDAGAYQDGLLDITYLALEKYHDLNLEDYLFDEHILPLYDINRGLKFCKQIINGMIFVHQNFIVHKDLKPSNVLLTHNLENAIIADFGSNEELKTSSSRVRCLFSFGTLGYRPPESLDKSYVSLKSDIFSLGVIFYFLLSKGLSPFGLQSGLWDHNTQILSIDLSCLHVSNPLATRHLIKAMLTRERCCRPSINETDCHPCWDGKEACLDFGYSFQEEVDDCDLDDESSCEAESSDGYPKDDFMREMESNELNLALEKEQIPYVGLIAFTELFGEKPLADVLSLPIIGSGQFGRVVLRTFRGQQVAVKFARKCDESDKDRNFTKFRGELEILKSLKHGNIINLFGYSEHEGILFLVMEYFHTDLEQYVLKEKCEENPVGGLSLYFAWAIAKQIAQAMLYLHSLNPPVAHNDLEPRNILVNTQPITPIPKLIDFDMAQVSFGGMADIPPLSFAQRLFHPNMVEIVTVKSMDDLVCCDVFAYGLVVLFMYTGLQPYEEKTMDYLADRGMSSPVQMLNEKRYNRHVLLSTKLESSELGKIILKCCSKKDTRPTFQDINKSMFGQEMQNPYRFAETFNMRNPFRFFESHALFKCGSINTHLLVVHSLIKDTMDAIYIPSSNKKENLICPVEVELAPDHQMLAVLRRQGMALREEMLYLKNYRKFCHKKRKHMIVNSSIIALSDLVADQCGIEGKVEMKFKQKTYCHHRAMRRVWKSFQPEDKEAIVSRWKGVNSVYSTSFSIRVAVLTNEGPGKTKKFVFTSKTSIRDFYSCGVVEHCDLIKDTLVGVALSKPVPNAAPELQYISLLKTAARGLNKLGLHLKGKDINAITLNTIYLNFDTYEWGLCGFVDLTNEKIQEENRFSLEKLKTSSLTSALKDNHQRMPSSIYRYGVDFELRTMVKWLRDNHDMITGCDKMVTVKLLQTFFGVAPVAKALAEKGTLQ